MITIGKWFDVLWNWAVYSSANPAKISTTIKYGGGLLATMLTVALGFGHIAFPSEMWTSIVDTTIQFVQEGALAITALGALVALLRKFYLTIRGEHVNVQQG